MNPFARVSVVYVVAGGATIYWELWHHFVDPGPYIFQLQVGHTGLNDADDWIDVGAPTVNGFAIDLDKRLFGKTLELHYRIKLTSAAGVYYSEPEGCDGLLIKRDWLTMREIVRKEMLRHRVQTSVNGFLLKARRYGPRCLVCTDPLTGEVSKTQCTSCYGTGFAFGYFAARPATFADIGLAGPLREHRDAQVGMKKEDVTHARFINTPMLYSYDVWVNSTSDERFYMHAIEVKAQIRAVPIIYEAELRVAPFTDIIYTVPLSGVSPLTAAATKKQVKPEIKAEEPVCPPKPIKPGLNYLEDALKELKERRARSSRR